MKDGIAAFVYRKILRPRPLRWFTNQLLLLALPKSVRLREGVLELNRRDPVISGALVLGVYENFERELFRDVVKEGMTVLDIGANVGIYTVSAAGLVGSQGRVIACEPEPENYLLLRRNVENNGFANAVLYDCAISDKSGSTELYLSKSNKGHHSLVPGASQKSDFTQSIRVDVRTGDSLLAEMGVHKVDVVKIDIEGAEPLAFKGLEKALSTADLTLFFEFSPRQLQEAGFDPVVVLSDLRKRGFGLFEIQESKKTILPINEFAEFVAKLPVDDYCNLLCVKGRGGETTIAKYFGRPMGR